ncbi:MAG TPA: DNA-binding protein [Firmicutes bacterium]|jgi:hypothetical protein|nr:DNA-binding protein [Bacillota bacterium]HAV20080.1 DNA-binding protein [Bacillota bacterium]
MNSINRYTETGRLLEKYGALLTYHQLQVMEQYYFYDLTMAEVAEEQKISRSAVSEIIKLTTEKLVEYEEKLHLLQLEMEILPLLESLALNSQSDKQDIINRIKERVKHGI